MRHWHTLGQKALAAILCLSLVIWSTAPSISHVPTIIDTLQEQAQMIADHGHSHGEVGDLIRALHGHSHDTVDHDHSQALAVPEGASIFALRDSWQLRPSRHGSYRMDRIERPPRA